MADRQGWEREDVERAKRARRCPFDRARERCGLHSCGKPVEKWAQTVDGLTTVCADGHAIDFDFPADRVVRELVEAGDELKRALALLSRSPTDEYRQAAFRAAQDDFDAALDAARPYLGDTKRLYACHFSNILAATPCDGCTCREEAPSGR